MEMVATHQQIRINRRQIKASGESEPRVSVEEMSRDLHIICRSVMLLNLIYRKTVQVSPSESKQIWKRIAFAAAVIDKLHERALRTTQSGTVKQLIHRLAAAQPFAPVRLYALYLMPTSATECTELLEEMLLDLNSDVSELLPKSLAHHLH